MLANVGDAYRAGVRIGAGSDTQGPNMSFGNSLHREIALLVAAGMSTGDALRAATDVAACAMEQSADFGTLRVGKAADILLIDGSPLAQIEDIGKIHLVIQQGRVVTRPSASQRCAI